MIQIYYRHKRRMTNIGLLIYIFISISVLCKLFLMLEVHSRNIGWFIDL